MERTMVIGITDCSKYANYENWFAGKENVRVVKLQWKGQEIEHLGSCDAVVLSGGEDVHPRYYGKEEYLPFCDDIDERRDEMELKVLEHVSKQKLPLLGICRGLQVANVFFGGTLIPDLPSFGKFNHSRFPSRDRYHFVQVDPYSQLASIAGSHRGQVNSAHHQSADRIGKELVASCISEDGTVEGIEWKDPSGKPFLQLVQWHPERMEDQRSLFASGVRDAFLSAVAAIRR